ncbi:MAG: BolA/IbaG family iron-sulfur metabolism protein [Burkholderiaceae bacterium]|nr:BolA/IbaG family iron-sulfur metabolism protein [Burkholderiaceae bacterium]
MLEQPTPQQVSEYIASGLNAAEISCTHLTVNGDGRHFQAMIVSDAFEGKSLVARHRLVYGVLGDRMREQIHALSMQTLTPAEWNQQQ